MKVEQHDTVEVAQFDDADRDTFRVRHGAGRATVEIMRHGIGDDRTVLSLRRALAGELAGLLQRFADTGKLAEPTEVPWPEAEKLMEPTHAEQLDFIRSRGWVPIGDRNLWVRSCDLVPGGVFKTAEQAYQAEMEPQEQAPSPGYPYAEEVGFKPPTVGGEPAPWVLQAQSDLQEPKTDIERAAIEWLEAREALTAAQLRFGNASDALERFLRVVGRPVVIAVAGQTYTIKYASGGKPSITAIPVLTAEQAQVIYNDPPF